MRRTGKIRNPHGGTVETNLTPQQAIRAFCTECLGWQGDPKDCASVLCPVWPYRGKSLAYNGKRTANMTDEQRQASSARLKAMRDGRRALKEAEAST